MKKEDLTVPAIFAEAIGMILGIVYIGLQIYYGIAYKVAPYKFICNIAGVVLIYVGLSLVSCQPEKINRLPKEVCVGKVRKYSIRMIRLVKLVFIIGLMVPCVGDVIGIELKDAYSLLVIAAILVITVFYGIGSFSCFEMIIMIRGSHKARRFLIAPFRSQAE